VAIKCVWLTDVQETKKGSIQSWNHARDPLVWWWISRREIRVNGSSRWNRPLLQGTRWMSLHYRRYDFQLRTVQLSNAHSKSLYMWWKVNLLSPFTTINMRECSSLLLYLIRLIVINSITHANEAINLCCICVDLNNTLRLLLEISLTMPGV